MIRVDVLTLAYNGSPSIHSLPQLSGSPVLRGHTGWSTNVDDSGLSSTVPGSAMTRPVRPDLGQLQAQLQQRLGQQRARNERSVSDWRPMSDCGSTAVDTQNVVPAPAPFSRYSAPPAAGVLIKSGPAVRPADKVSTMFVPSPSQHAAAPLPPSSSSSAAAVKPGQSLPAAAAAARPQSGVLAKSGVGGGCAPAAMSSTVTVVHSSPTSQHVRSAALCADVARVLLSHWRNFLIVTTTVIIIDK